MNSGEFDKAVIDAVNQRILLVLTKSSHSDPLIRATAYPRKRIPYDKIFCAEIDIYGDLIEHIE